MNSFIYIYEIYQYNLKPFLKNNSSRSNWATDEFFQRLKRKKKKTYTNSSKNRKRGRVPKSVYKVSLTVILKPTRKKYHTPISLMNIVIEVHKKHVRRKWIQWYKKKVIYNDQVEFIPEMQS